MAAYQEVTLKAKFYDSTSGTSKDYTPTAHNPGSGTYRYEIRDVLAATGGTTIDLGSYTTVTNILIKNNDATNYVEATFRTTGGAANNQVLRAAAGQVIATGTAITVANDLVLTANTAAVACEICVIGT